MVSLVGWGMKHGQSHPKQFPDELPRVIVAALTVQTEVTPKDTPCRFRKVCITVG